MGLFAFLKEKFSHKKKEEKTEKYEKGMAKSRQAFRRNV